MKKIGLLCLCLASLTLVGCFHIPDENWLPSKNKVETTQKDDQVEQALNSFMEGINIISSEWDGMKGEGNDEITIEDGEENTIEIEDETLDDEEITDNEIENEEVENEVVESEAVEDDTISEE